MPIVAPEVAERRRYLDAKRDKLGHLLPSLVLRIGCRCGALTSSRSRSPASGSTLETGFRRSARRSDLKAYNVHVFTSADHATATAALGWPTSFHEGTYMFTRYQDSTISRMTGANRAIALSLGRPSDQALAAAQTVELKTLEPGVKTRQPQSPRPVRGSRECLQGTQVLFGQWGIRPCIQGRRQGPEASACR